MPEAPHRPSLRITGMHIERLKAIESLTLPEDGLGWAGEIPSVVMVGGMNGAGKTTLLRFIVEVLIEASGGFGRPMSSDDCAWMDFEVVARTGQHLAMRYVVGPAEFFDAVAKPISIGFRAGKKFHRGQWGALAHLVKEDVSAIPGVVFLPSDERDLKLPPESYKAPGMLASTTNFVYRWSPPKRWKDSLEALLYGLRWEELNAQAEGRTTPGAFSAYAEEYHQLTGGANRLVWHNAVLMVDVDGQLHPLEELSSGERQVLLLLAELRRHWRPGSLVLIDEPELHLHDVLQARLYDRLLALQRERGGQVWLATQSGYLFEVAEPNTRVILRRKSAE